MVEVHVKGSPSIEVNFESKVTQLTGGVIVDPELSLDSENPVMNKVITEELNKLTETVGEGIPIGNGEADNSAVLKGGNNQALSENSVAVGSNNVVGLKGFYYKSISFLDSNRANIFITKNQQIPIIDTTSPASENIPISQYLSIGDKISIINDVKYDNCAEIIQILTNDKGIRVKWITSQPFTTIKSELILDKEDYSIYCLDKPDAGIVDLGVASFAAGRYNKAINNNATVFGFNNEAYGKFSFVEGRDNKAGYAAHAEGRENVASGEQSHAEGLSTTASGNHSHSEGQDTTASAINAHAEGNRTTASGVDSHAEGFSTEASGLRSHAEGSQNKATEHGSHVEGVSNESGGVGSHVEGLYNTGTGRASHAEGENNKAFGDRSHVEGSHNKTTNNVEHAEGKYNKSNTNTIHSVGIGTSDTDRKNAHEITNDGKHYIYGVGGYDGTNPSESDDLAKAIANSDVCMIDITYDELVSLRDNSQLKAGMFYRITDYVTTTVQKNTQSAGHVFDVIVMATDSKTLSEEARAIVHEGDTYFTEAGANLAAWKVWYALDNDSTRFAWADAENGKGVIYRLIDEWNNDCPYDFKNIMYVRYELASPETVEDEPWLAQMSANIQAQFASGQLAYIWGGVMSEDVYWEEEAGAVFSSPTGNTKAFFTFTSFINNEVFDKSLTPKCHDNTIGKLLRNVEELSNNVFFATTENSACYSNSFDVNCYFNSFGNNCSSNSFDVNCYFNSFGDGCYSNSFGDNCYSNSFGDDCHFNSFGNNCSSNSFDVNCYFNSFGNNCSSNSFDVNCYFNSFGDGCYSNSFGDNCYSNSFGDDCHSNSFGNNGFANSFDNNGYSNSFGNECRSNSFGNECYYNSFGNNCRSISFGDNCSYNSFGNGCQSCKCGNHWTNCRFGNGCRTVYTNSEAEPAHYVRNLEIAQGCENVRITIATTASSNSQLQNVHIATMSNTLISGLNREKLETAYVEVKNGYAAIGYLGSLDIFVLD